MQLEEVFDKQNEKMMTGSSNKCIDLNLVIAFGIGNDTFAVKLTDCKEVVEEYQMTPMPVLNKKFKGVINLRGTLVPVVNKLLMFGKLETNYNFSEKPKIVILEHSDSLIGVEIDFARKEFLNTESERAISNKDTCILTINEIPIKFITSNWLKRKLED